MVFTYIIIHCIHSGGIPPHHHHHHHPSLPPFQPPSLSVSVSEFLTEDLQNNGVTSCSRSVCLQQSFQPSVHQAGAHLIWDLQVTVKFPLFFFKLTAQGLLSYVFCVMYFYVVWLFPCLDVYMRGLTGPPCFFQHKSHFFLRFSTARSLFTYNGEWEDLTRFSKL